MERHTENRLRIVRIERVAIETEDIRSFSFRDRTCSTATPGQYVMVWIPGVDEVPMSLSSINRKGVSQITVRRVGRATEEIHDRTKGDLVGLRGPFGNGFEFVDGKSLLVGGGTGIATLSPLAERLSLRGASMCFITGFRSRQHVYFLKRLVRLSQQGHEVMVVTDDGSIGKKGLASEWAEKKMEETPFDVVYTCGPELMMTEVFDQAERHGIPVQASLERLIKCSVGLCGSCAIGGFRICRDGPVLSSEQLRTVADEFGKFRLDQSGKPERVNR